MAVIEVHKKFPRKVNAEFVEVVDHETLKMRVWGARIRGDVGMWYRCLRYIGCDCYLIRK